MSTSSVLRRKHAFETPREDYQELSRIGVPQRFVDVDDNVFIADNNLLQTSMRPQFRKQPAIPRANEYKARLDLYTGQYQRSSKKEQAPLFDLFKEDYLPDRNNIMNQVNNQAGRFRDETSTHAKNYETPITAIKVPPGLNKGYTADPTNRPFHEWWRPREYTRDELTGIVRPSFELDRTDGALMGDGGILRPDYEKKRPETVYGIPQGQVISNIFGAVVKPIKEAGKFIERLVNRGATAYDRSATGMSKEGMKPGDYILDKEREESRVRRDPTSRAGAMNLTGREADFNTLDRTAGLEVPTPKKVEYQNKVVERDGALIPLVYENNNPDIQGTRVSKLAKKLDYIENNRPDAPNSMVGKKASHTYEPGHVSKTPMHNEYLQDIPAKAGPTTDIKAQGVFNPVVNPSKHSEYLIQNRPGDASIPGRDQRGDKSMLVHNNPIRTEFLEKRPTGMATGDSKGTVYSTITPRIIKKGDAKPYKGQAGGTEIGSSVYRSHQNINADNKKHSAVVLNHSAPQQRPQSFTRPESGFLVNTRTNKKLLMQDGLGNYSDKHFGYVGNTRVASNRFADDPGPLPWPTPSAFRFSPQYSWQVRDPAGHRRNPGPPITNAMRPMKRLPDTRNREDPKVLIPPRMKFVPANFSN